MPVGHYYLAQPFVPGSPTTTDWTQSAQSDPRSIEQNAWVTARADKNTGLLPDSFGGTIVQEDGSTIPLAPLANSFTFPIPNPQWSVVFTRGGDAISATTTAGGLIGSPISTDGSNASKTAVAALVAAAQQTQVDQATAGAVAGAPPAPPAPPPVSPIPSLQPVQPISGPTLVSTTTGLPYPLNVGQITDTGYGEVPLPASGLTLAPAPIATGAPAPAGAGLDTNGVPASAQIAPTVDAGAALTPPAPTGLAAVPWYVWAIAVGALVAGVL